MRYIITLLLVSLSACGTPVPVPTDHFYLLPELKARRHQTPVYKTLYVKPLNAVGLVRERPIVYQESAGSLELKRYHYHLWHDSPAAMLQTHLADYMRQSGVAVSVTTSPSLAADTVVSGNLLEFMQITGNGSQQVVVSLELRLQHTDNAESFIAKNYTEYESVNGTGMTAVIAAFGRALKRIFDDFATTVVAYDEKAEIEEWLAS